MNRKNQGFTLVELIIVIVILGILAAYVTSRFSNLDTSARKSTMSTLYSSIKSASAGVHGAAVTSNLAGNDDTTVRVEGNDVGIAYGYAKANDDGIMKAIDDSSIGDGRDISKTISGNDIIFKHAGARSGDTWKVVYTYNPDGNNVPSVTIDVSACE